MCGIIGIFKRDATKIKDALQIMQNRGRDSCGVFSENRITHKKEIKELPNTKSDTIAHLLHSVVGCVAQPIQKKGVLIANCEIYNWMDLKKKYGLQSKNDAELIIDLIEKKGIKQLKEILMNDLDGVYAFAYWINNEVYLARDIIGIKPLWISKKEGFCFASEKKALLNLDCKEIVELNPRTILVYSTKEKVIKTIKRDFFKLGKNTSTQIQEETQELVEQAIVKRIPNQKFGILFSGGIDSTFIAQMCKQKKQDFVCYTAALKEEGMGEAQDLVYAKKIAKEFGISLKIKTITLKEVEPYLKKIVPLIEDSNVVKVGVALPFYLACEMARKDGIKVMFSGLGSEEIFAGYDRHKKSLDINKECRSGLLKMYERDLYRDDVVTMNNAIELRLPFLDKALVKYALSIPAEKKLSSDQNKIVLRDIAEVIGIPKEFAQRKKQAAQYGSKFDRAIEKLAKRAGFAKKSEYLEQFYQKRNVKLGVLWSSGKDSAYAAWTMQRQNYDLSCLISLKSKNTDSYMFHTPNIDVVDVQAQAMNIPLIVQKTSGEKEKELIDLKKAIQKAKKEYKIEGVVSGALYSTYQRERIEKICDELDLKIFSPLWHIDQEQEMRSLLKEGFDIMFSSVAALGFDKSWVGRKIEQKDVNQLVKLNKKFGINIAGEGGEFESLVINCPLFKKKISVNDIKINEESKHAAKAIISVSLTK